MLRVREHAEQDSWSPLFKTHNLIMRAAFPPRCKQCSDCQLLVNALIGNYQAANRCQRYKSLAGQVVRRCRSRKRPH